MGSPSLSILSAQSSWFTNILFSSILRRQKKMILNEHVGLTKVGAVEHIIVTKWAEYAPNKPLIHVTSAYCLLSLCKGHALLGWKQLSVQLNVSGRNENFPWDFPRNVMIHKIQMWLRNHRLNDLVVYRDNSLIYYLTRKEGALFKTIKRLKL